MADIMFETNVERGKLVGEWSPNDEKYEKRFRSFMDRVGNYVFDHDQLLAAKPEGLELPEGINAESLRRRVVGVPHIRALSIELVRTLFREDSSQFTPETWAEQTMLNMDHEEFERMSARTVADAERTMPLAAVAGAEFIIAKLHEGYVDFAFKDYVVQVTVS